MPRIQGKNAMRKRNIILLVGTSVLAICSLLFICIFPVRENRIGKLEIIDQDGAQHDMYLVTKWPIVPLWPYFYVEMGKERWLVHSGESGYADTAFVQTSPDRKTAVVAYQFEGCNEVFVKFDLASEKGTRERGYSTEFHLKGWEQLTWQRLD